jgi:predicted ATPase/DNA-binding SARP family transcriptional activator
MDQLWPAHAPEAAANNLYQVLHLARRILDPGGSGGYLALQDEVLRLACDASTWVDVVAFEAAAEAARRSQTPAAYQAALDLYTGDLLPGDRYVEWAVRRRETLRRQYRGLLIDLAQVYVARDAHLLAIATLEQVVASDPADEEAQRALMRCYASIGQRHTALRQYQLLRAALDRELAVEPDALTEALHQQILAGRLEGAPAAPTLAVTYSRAPAAAPHLPAALTSFIGRAGELAELHRLLATTRLLTLVGPGGCGKTRLALEIAGQLLAEYADGVWLVELAALADPALAAQTVAAALGVRETPAQPPAEALVAMLWPKQLLLVLDNCEHLVTACAQLSETLLRACPQLRILATSREPLHVPGELIWRVPPMALPDPRQLPPFEDRVQYAAIRLFADRAAAVAPTFTLDQHNAATVARLCAGLDGQPLAIELAAAQARVLSLAQLADRLGERLRLLRSGSRTAPQRHQTLRAALDWSYDLLSEPERQLYARLAVFAGGFDLEAAEVVGAGAGLEAAEVLALLTQLVDKSLVVVEQGLAARYHLPETLRQYGLERLAERGEAGASRRRHAQVFLALAEAATPAFHGGQQMAWLARFTAEHDNFRAALAWSLEALNEEQCSILNAQFSISPQEIGLRMAGALAWFWLLRGHVTEGRRWLDQLLARSAGWEPTAARARALRGAGGYAVIQGDYGIARAQAEASVAMARAVGDERELAYALLWLSSALVYGGDPRAALALTEESLGICKRLGDQWGQASALLRSGIPALELGEITLAQARFVESLVLYRAVEERWGMASALVELGNLAYRHGDYGAARAHLEEVLAIEQEMQDQWFIVQALGMLGEIARAQGDDATATAVGLESLALARALSLKAIEAWALRNLGYVAAGHGDTRRASTYFAESLALFRTVGSQVGIACCLAGFAAVACADGQPQRAARLFGATEALFSASAATLAPADRAEYERGVATLRDQLDAQVFAAAWAAGRTLALEQAITEALRP